MNYVFLGVAIVAEVIGTSALKASEGFTRLGPSLLVLACGGVGLYFLSLALETIPTGVAYAIWSGVGIVLVATIGWVWAKQPLDGPAIVGIGLILAGVVIMNLFSKTVSH